MNDKKENKNNRIPNFIGIGAPKCGTTWISTLLMKHPEVYIPPSKELLYFSDRYFKGVDWYLNHFKAVEQKHKVVGEFSVNYMQNSSLPSERIYEFDPNVKIIVMLRDPVYRAFSHYRWLQQMGKLNPKMSFLEAIKVNKDIIEYSLYFNNIIPYLNKFNLNNIHIIIYEKIIEEPKSVYVELLKFLNIDQTYIPRNLNKNIGKTITPRYLVLEKLRILIFSISKKYDLLFLIKLSKKSGLSSLYRNINDNKKSKRSLSENEYNICELIIKDDLAKLRNTLGITIEQWCFKNYIN